jgi:hypothetical protein
MHRVARGLFLSIAVSTGACATEIESESDPIVTEAQGEEDHDGVEAQLCWPRWVTCQIDAGVPFTCEGKSLLGRPATVKGTLARHTERGFGCDRKRAIQRAEEALASKVAGDLRARYPFMGCKTSIRTSCVDR